MYEEINDCRPDAGDNEQKQDLCWIAKGGKVEFGAAVRPGRNDNFWVRRSGDVGGIGLKGRRCDSVLRFSRKGSR